MHLHILQVKNLMFPGYKSKGALPILAATPFIINYYLT